MVHYVNRYETLYSIALFHGTTVPHLLYLNPQIVNPHWIYPGEVIRVR